MSGWSATGQGVLVLPSGRLVRGRSIRQPALAEGAPEFGVYLLGQPPPPQLWASRWVRWPDFRLPVDPCDARDALHEAWSRAVAERVELACHGGRGRTGTALACLAVLEGMPAREAVAHVRRHYHPRAVETPGQRRFVARFAAAEEGRRG